MQQAIAVVGMACRYPEARSPAELWENVLAGRRSFRRIPAERLSLNDYYSSDPQAPDSIYSTQGAFIEGYEFDRVRFRVAGSVYRSVDLTHWLALDVAADAFADAGFQAGDELPHVTTGVFIGNTLTGEFSRANVMRLRWPYVRRVLSQALAEGDCPPERARELLDKTETLYKQPFPAVNEETLAGGLSNTIAGRICNYFDLKGGGYTLDGACASSLLAVINACANLTAGDLDVALAGGVDLSIDPFELVGFAKAGALARDEMRVYDSRSAGFWPGEGCGLIVLMRHEDAVAQGRQIYAVIRGCGVSSDGSGGITRPEVEGQLYALRRAYKQAGYGIETVAYFEGHGTGTTVGDATELQALSRALRDAGGPSIPAAIGTIKANIGHTKAAAGVAGLIKAAMALHTQVLPPTTGCIEPHQELKGQAAALKALRQAELYPADGHLRAGVSAMGFGGINTHLTLEVPRTERRRMLNSKERALSFSAQDVELFAFAARNTDELLEQLNHLEAYAERLSRSELIDLSAQLQKKLGRGDVRAAIVASTPYELAMRLAALKDLMANGVRQRIDARNGIFLGIGSNTPRVGFLFTGQGAPLNADGGAWSRRFEFVQELYAAAQSSEQRAGDTRTETAQPAIVKASISALRVLSRLGLTAAVAVGHSLGELTALHWAEAFDEQALARIASVRGRAMAMVDGPAGKMISVNAGRQAALEMLNGKRVVVAGLNSPVQTILSGEAEAIEAVARSAVARGLRCLTLPVSHAFHSPLVAAAAPTLSRHLASEELRPLRRTVFSTVTGERLASHTDLRELLCTQVTSPVRFMDAVNAACDEGVDLWIEVGPGQTLCGLVKELTDAPAIALDAGGASLQGLLCAVGACFVFGAQVACAELFAGRFTRPFNLEWRPRFFVNPCELAPASDAPIQFRALQESPAAPFENREAATAAPSSLEAKVTTLELVRQLVAERVELPVSAVTDDNRLLDDLHLNSITVAQLVTEAARRLNASPPVAPTHYANATIAEIAEALDGMTRGPLAATAAEHLPPGVDTWVRAFSVELVERSLQEREPPRGDANWRVLASPDYPRVEELRRAFAQLGAGSGVVVALPPEPDESSITLLLEGARAALKQPADFRFVLVQHGGGAASFARTLHLEAMNLITCTVDVPLHHPQSIAWVVAEALAARGYTEAHYDDSGRRREPVLRPSDLEQQASELPITAEDVFILTGGARGITAECAFALASETKARLALFGTSQPTTGGEVATNLERMAAAGIDFRYYALDITDAAAVCEAVTKVKEDFGCITGIVHGAALNVPCLLEHLDEPVFLKTLRPKLQGARNLLAAIDAERLRFFIAFGSIIARSGLPGEAHYGLSNEWLVSLTERWQAEHPKCRCLAVEWSVWSGVGMGARLGTIDALAQQGVTPITPEQGVQMLRQLLCRKLPTPSTIVMGRYRDMPTLNIEKPELPLLRFLERPRVFYPKVELVVDAELSTETDLYLDDHALQGERLLPAVIGLEAMAQTVMGLMALTTPPVFEQVAFERPVLIREKAATTIRVAALARTPRLVEVVLRSSETNFQMNHFRAFCNIEAQAQAASSAQPEQQNGQLQNLPLSPERDLYGKILFHRGRFRRLRGYRELRATECLAEIMPDGNTKWFSQYLPGELVLGDPGARDAAIHAVQACIPHATLLPIGVERVSGEWSSAGATHLVRARELSSVSGIFVYDLELIDAEGKVRERWERLSLRLVNGTTFNGPWPAGLLAPYLERRVRELIPGARLSIALECDPHIGRRLRGQRTIQRASGESTRVFRRDDGKPLTANGCYVSASHAGDLTLAVSGRVALGCDVERIGARKISTWRDLLGAENFALAELISREAGSDFDTAATRVWTAVECRKKVGCAMNAPLTLVKLMPDAWALLASGESAIASCVVSVDNMEERLAIALLVEVDDARL
jgi:enediyne polyketide synthase